SSNAFTIKSSNANLADVSGTINYNPAGAPYAGATPSTDSTYTTSYASVISGLVYVSGNLITSTSHPVFNGSVVVGGTVTISAALDVTYAGTTLYSNPPPGFTGSGPLSTVSATWRWERAN